MGRSQKVEIVQRVLMDKECVCCLLTGELHLQCSVSSGELIHRKSCQFY